MWVWITHYLIALLWLFIIFILFFIIGPRVKPVSYKNKIKNNTDKVDISKFLTSRQIERMRKISLEKDHEFIKNKILEKLDKKYEKHNITKEDIQFFLDLVKK